MYCKKPGNDGRHIVVVKVTRNKTVLSVFINVNPNCLLIIKVAKYYRVIALILADIVPSLDIKGRELGSIPRYLNEGQYSPISVR